MTKMNSTSEERSQSSTSGESSDEIVDRNDVPLQDYYTFVEDANRDGYNKVSNDYRSAF